MVSVGAVLVQIGKGGDMEAIERLKLELAWFMLGQGCHDFNVNYMSTVTDNWIIDGGSRFSKPFNFYGKAWIHEDDYVNVCGCGINLADASPDLKTAIFTQLGIK